MKLSKLTKPELDEIFRNANFTEEEEKVFWDLSRGISQKEISFRHSISVTTVERRVRSIKNKLKRLEGDRFGTSNMEILQYAVSNGMIDTESCKKALK
mgnify:CR=1 FL=1